MGFLKRIFRNVFRDGAQVGTTSSFSKLSEEDLEAHLRVARYGDFVLTDAVRPSYDLQVVPTQGYRHDEYYDEESHARVPVVMAAAESLPSISFCNSGSAGRPIDTSAARALSRIES